MNATLIDPLPVSTTFQSISAPGWTCNTPAIGATGNISCTHPSLAPSAVNSGNPVVSTISVVAKAVSGLPTNLQITNGAMVSSLTKELFNPDNGSFLSGPAVVTTTGCVAGRPVIFRSSGTSNAVLTAESCPNPPAPANSAVDPREQVTMSFCLQNLSGATTLHLRGTLQATGGITNPTAGTVQFGDGALVAFGAEKCGSFSFKVANVNCGARFIASIDLLDDNNANLGTVQWEIPTGVGGGGQPFVCCTSSPTAANGSISGTVTNGGMPVSGAVINLAGAQTRKTITDAGGNYRFDEVDTNGFYTVTPSMANYTFSPRERSFSQTGNTTNAAFTATANAVMDVNAIETPEYFVRQHYLDFLGREPDESGFNFWSDQMLQCGSDAGCLEQSRVNVSAAYFFSIEFQQTGGLVDRLYRASYDRRPLYSEFTPDARTVAHDVIVGRADWAQQLETNKQAFVEAWVQRDAFRAEYDGLTNDRYVDTLIAHTGVNYNQGEKAALVTRLTAGMSTRADVLRQIVEDERFVDAKRNESFVMMEYFGYLQRDPDDSGYQFWLTKLKQFNGNFEQAEMVKAFIVSGEYRDRFPR